MATSADLQKQARGFAEEINDLLNRTILHGPCVRTICSMHGDRAWIGFGIKPDDLVPSEGMPITIGDAPAKLFLRVYHVLTLEPGTNYLTNARSDAGVYGDQAMTVPIFRYDYERNKKDGYPESHLHVFGAQPALEEVESGSQLGGLHFPLGGRRFRPGLEDVIEMLVREKLAVAHNGWEKVVDSHRERFHKIQLKAAARNDPDTAQLGIDAAQA